ALRGRYDDAVARCYRLLEWMAQWHLRRRHDIDVGAVRWDHALLTKAVIERAQLERQQGQKTLSGLMQGLKLAAALPAGEPFSGFLTAPVPGKRDRNGEHELRNMLELRNRSILAHGATPLELDDWKRLEAFMQHVRRSLLGPLLRAAGCDADVAQLPVVPPEGL